MNNSQEGSGGYVGEVYLFEDNFAVYAMQAIQEND